MGSNKMAYHQPPFSMQTTARTNSDKWQTDAAWQGHSPRGSLGWVHSKKAGTGAAVSFLRSRVVGTRTMTSKSDQCLAAVFFLFFQKPEF
jgi:hypothetical protein